MERTAIRELAFKLIYSLEIQKNQEIQEAIELYIEANQITNTSAQKYIEDAAMGVKEHIKEIDEKIEKNLKAEWKMERISKIDLSILRLAIYEITYKEEVPFKVAINEAVELAKKYGEDNSKKFVNGILASVVKESEQQA